MIKQSPDNIRHNKRRSLNRRVFYLFFRRVVGFYGTRLDDDTCVTPLVVLAFVGNRPRHVTTCNRYHTSHNDCHD